MSKIVSRLLEDIAWLDDLSSVLTVFFVILFVLIVVSVLRLKKERVEEYKNMPLSDNDNDTDIP